MSEQANLLLETDTITMNEFDKLYDKLMRRTWTVDGQTFNLAESGWDWKYNSRKTSLGLCRFNKHTGLKVIFISKSLLSVNLEGNAKEFEDTVRHEIAHAIDYEIRRTSSHCRIWQDIAVQVGANPRKGKSVNGAKAKWTGTCINCGEESHRHVLRGNAKRSACAKCCNKHNGGYYTDAYILKWTKNF